MKRTLTYPSAERSKYFFRTRKNVSTPSTSSSSDDEAAAAAVAAFARNIRGPQKGYLFRTKKTPPAGLVSRSYLFRT